MADPTRPIPARLRLLRGNPSKRPIKPDLVPTPLVELPEPPSFLNPYGRAEWLRIVPQLVAKRVLSELDLGVFAGYCQSYGRWVETEEEIARLSKGDPSIRKLVRAAHAEEAMMRRFAVELGLAPAARARVKIEPEPVSSKFAGLLDAAERTSAARLGDIIAPRSVAVVGASEDLGKFGGRVLHHLIKHRFQGRIVPVNPNRPDLFGLNTGKAASANC